MKKNLANILIGLAAALGLASGVHEGIELHRLRAERATPVVVGTVPQATDAVSYALATAPTAVACEAAADGTAASK